MPLQDQADSVQVTSFPATGTTAFVLAGPASRKALTIFNDTQTIFYVKLGDAPTTGSFTAKLASGTLFEIKNPAFTGLVYGKFHAVSGDGKVNVTDVS